jgi:hypothetical protein
MTRPAAALALALLAAPALAGGPTAIAAVPLSPTELRLAWDVSAEEMQPRLLLLVAGGRQWQDLGIVPATATVRLFALRPGTMYVLRLVDALDRDLAVTAERTAPRRCRARRPVCQLPH